MFSTGVDAERYQHTLDSINIILSEKQMEAIDDAGRRGGIKRRYARNVFGDTGHVKIAKQTRDSTLIQREVKSKW
jgi:hypothetical protein